MIYSIVKRAFDVIIATLFLIVTFPILIILIFFIRLDGQGKAVFKQDRVGKNGKIFALFKLRTMNKVDVKFNLENAVIEDDNPVLTKLGRVLRKLKIDELPQLINVIKGEMSIVGPRPLLPIYWLNYQEWEKEKFTVKPGMTGYAQVCGNGYLSQKERSYYDVYYAKNFNFWLDIKIIFLTVRVIIKGERACIKRVEESKIEELIELVNNE